MRRVISREEPIEIQLEWSVPEHTFGPILGYRIRYGIKNQTLKEHFIEGDRVLNFKIKDLGKSW